MVAAGCWALAVRPRWRPQPLSSPEAAASPWPPPSPATPPLPGPQAQKTPPPWQQCWCCPYPAAHVQNLPPTTVPMCSECAAAAPLCQNLCVGALIWAMPLSGRVAWASLRLTGTRACRRVWAPQYTRWHPRSPAAPVWALSWASVALARAVKAWPQAGPSGWGSPARRHGRRVVHAGPPDAGSTRVQVAPPDAPAPSCRPLRRSRRSYLGRASRQPAPAQEGCRTRRRPPAPPVRSHAARAGAEVAACSDAAASSVISARRPGWRGCCYAGASQGCATRSRAPPWLTCWGCSPSPECCQSPENWTTGSRWHAFAEQDGEPDRVDRDREPAQAAIGRLPLVSL
jgi:hypothetical protein